MEIKKNKFQQIKNAYSVGQSDLFDLKPSKIKASAKSFTRTIAEIPNNPEEKNIKRINKLKNLLSSLKEIDISIENVNRSHSFSKHFLENELKNNVQSRKVNDKKRLQDLCLSIFENNIDKSKGLLKVINQSFDKQNDLEKIMNILDFISKSKL